MGCKRTIDEISNWSRYSDEERNKIMKRLGYGRRKGGRDKNVTKR
jgi:predicted Fe-S protein YdhL (DUF1289 family)